MRMPYSTVKTGLLAVTFTLTLALAAGVASAQGHGGRGGPDMMSGLPIEMMLDASDASDAQRAQIKQIMQAARADLKAQHADGQKLHEQGLALFTAAHIDAAAIESLRQQMQAQREVGSKRMSQAMVDAARVLSPEQRAKLAEKMKKMQARRAEHRQEMSTPSAH